MTVIVATTVAVTCEGPRCPGRNGEAPTLLNWNEQKAQTDPNELPDDAYRLVTFQPFVSEKHVFCSVKCEHDWQDKFYIPAKSPRELAREDEINQKVDDRNKEKAAKKDTGDVISDAVGVATSVGVPALEPVAQADGTT